MIELWRRLTLIAGLSLSVCLFFALDLTSLVRIDYANFAKQQKKPTSLGILTETQKKQAALPLDEYIREMTKGKTLNVAGQDWEILFNDMSALARKEYLGMKWKDRAPAYQAGDNSIHTLYFRIDEYPIKLIAEDLHTGSKVEYLTMEGLEPPLYLSVRRLNFVTDDFKFGFSVTSDYGPPSSFFHPLRKFAVIPLFCAILAYILLPWPKHRPESVSCKRSRVILSDFLGAILLFLPIYILPLFLGGGVGTFPNWWWITLILWPLCLLALWLCKYAAWYSNFEINCTGTGLEINVWGRVREIPYKSVREVQEAVLMPPKWLIVLMWMGALFSRGRAKIGATGHAAILSAAAYQGISLNLDNGQRFMFWYSDQMGNSIFDNLDHLQKRLSAQKIHKNKETLEIRGFGPDMTSDFDKGDGRVKLASSLIFFSPFIVFAVFFLTGF